MWKRAAGALKDNNSIFLASFSSTVDRHHSSVATVQLRDQAFRTLIIKATSHDRESFDYKSAQRILSCVHASPATLDPLQLALANRMGKTRSWAVALKGLLHRLSCSSRIPSLRRLPFDLSRFRSSDSKSSPFDAFVRSYYDFLHHRSALADQLNHRPEDRSISRQLSNLGKIQNLLDCILRIKPLETGMRVRLISEAMDCVVIEIYTRICTCVAEILLRIGGAAKPEAELAFSVIHRAASQGDGLSQYFHHCHRMGVLAALQCPQMEKIPDHDIRQIQRIIAGEEIEKPVASSDGNNRLRTIITDKWEVFEDDLAIVPYKQEEIRETNWIVPCGKEGIREANQYMEPAIGTSNGRPEDYRDMAKTKLITL